MPITPEQLGKELADVFNKEYFKVITTEEKDKAMQRLSRYPANAFFALAKVLQYIIERQEPKGDLLQAFIVQAGSQLTTEHGTFVNRDDRPMVVEIRRPAYDAHTALMAERDTYQRALEKERERHTETLKLLETERNRPQVWFPLGGGGEPVPLGVDLLVKNVSGDIVVARLHATGWRFKNMVLNTNALHAWAHIPG